MKFNILKVILWLKSGNVRELKFEPEKINLITGDSSTGKTDIINIIYYCLFDENRKITESIINENVDWYGIKLQINDKLYTVCRYRIEDGHTSDKFFFSSTGEIPNHPEVNNTKHDVKSIIETEFSISKDTNIPFGGKYIQKGSKISLDYLLMLNLLDVSIIENQDIYVAFQNIPRYREALERVFYLSLGIETVENITAREKYNSLSDEIKKLERKQEVMNNQKVLFHDELQDIVNKVKSYGLIKNELGLDDSVKQIEILLENLDSKDIYAEESEREKLKTQLTLIQYKLRNLTNFQDEYQKYQDTQKKNLESLQPIDYLLKKDNELVKTSIYEDILQAYKDQISEIKKITSDKSPINNQIRSVQIDLEGKKKEIESLLSNLPEEDNSFNSDKEKIYFLGQIKSKLELYKAVDDKENYSTQIETLKEQLDRISVVDISTKRDNSKTIAESYMKSYMDIIRTSLENYKDYIPSFDIKGKSLQFINPTKNIVETIGSSSNHMFMQLLFSLGVHMLAFVNKSKFLAPFLIIDQLSRPYYGKNNEKKNMDSSDESKIKNAFKLLNEFIKQIHSENGNFQMIVLEHIPVEYVSDLENIHVVEEFFNGNALIPHSEYESINRG
ncbi:MAG: DUF3732 domain-containing protein [Spirochaetales bacterium]|nr:DUF3732 domain-containing protein [Spirochaetales bacterium]